jgi:hypothetical protein
MALTIIKTGSTISTEKLVIQVTSDDPLVTSVIMNVRLVTGVNAHTLEHQPIFGSTNVFQFEVNSILKDYFNFEFQALTGAGTTVIENVISRLLFNEVISGVIQGVDYTTSAIIQNITQDVFEIEDFSFADYDCGTLGTTASKFLTSAPNPLVMGDNTSNFLSVLETSYTGTPGSLTPDQEWVKLDFDSLGALVNTTLTPVSVPVRSIDGAQLIGVYDIDTLRIDMDTSTGIVESRVYIRDILTPFTLRSETRIYKVNDACEKSITLSWYNELGTQDTYTLLGNITRSGKYTDSTFKRVRPVNPLSTNVGDLVYKSSYNYEYDLFSDRMPENAVQWLSNILINKRAAIQIEAVKPVQPDLNGLIYNWFVIDAGGGGDGTANGGIVNQSQTGWAVPSALAGVGYSLLNTFLSGNAGSLKETGFINWDSPNTGATNSANFNAVGSGARDSVIGVFFDIKQGCYLMTYEDFAGNYNYTKLSYNSSTFSATSNLSVFGSAIRLVRLAVGGENDGDLITAAYIGNNGISYDGVVIGTQVWITSNLYETELNDGTTIPNITDNTDWKNLTTGALSSYGNVTINTGGKIGKYFPIVIDTDKTVLEDKFAPETLFRLKFRLANERKGLK